LWAGRPKRMAAHVGVDAGVFGAPPDHAPDVDAVASASSSARRI
jgi:hypothetical protein